MLTARTGAVPRDDVWVAWSLDPMVLVAITTVLVLYAVALWSERSRRGASSRASSRTRRRTLAASAAVVVLVVALASPLDAAAEALFSFHMVQHLLLTAVAAPLLVLAAPGPTLRRLLPPPWRRAAALAARWTASPGRRQPAAPAAIGTVVVLLTLSAWHVPWLYDAALRNDTVHALEHVSILAAGVTYWSAVIRAARRSQTLVSVMALAVASMHGAALGALLALAPRPWYEGHEVGAAAWQVDALADQQVAGAIMWVPTAVIYLGTMAIVLHRALREPASDRPVRAVVA